MIRGEINVVFQDNGTLSVSELDLDLGPICRSDTKVLRCVTFSATYTCQDTSSLHAGAGRTPELC